MSRNNRRHARNHFVAPVRVGWQDADRNDKVALTRVLDISESGLRFEIPEPIPLRSDVTVCSEKIGLRTRAVVRFCECHGSKYAVGVEFAGGYLWRAPDETTRHDMQQAHLIAADAAASLNTPH